MAKILTLNFLPQIVRSFGQNEFDTFLRVYATLKDLKNCQSSCSTLLERLINPKYSAAQERTKLNSNTVLIHFFSKFFNAEFRPKWTVHE